MNLRREQRINSTATDWLCDTVHINARGRSPPYQLDSRGRLVLPEAQVGEKVDLKLNIQKTKIMASGPTTSWEIDGETVGALACFQGSRS